ncbi:hypothetical protein ACQ5SO_02295 [Rhodovulum sp. DZ06]|uniref:hypothetical protein n=1 Tax=Rhodovulum sp. DZ06 TaxID=3425126 RepID=UPI003D346D30
MARILAAALALALVSTAGPLPAQERPRDMTAELDSNGHAQTCKHFANRARFRHLAPAHLVAAAEACPEALARAGEPAADALLDGLTRLRLTVREMNTTRLYGRPDPGPRAFPVAAANGAWAAASAPGRPVSRSGEYLIAREMGVLAALRAWRAVD